MAHDTCEIQLIFFALFRSRLRKCFQRGEKGSTRFRSKRIDKAENSSAKCWTEIGLYQVCLARSPVVYLSWRRVFSTLFPIRSLSATNLWPAARSTDSVFWPKLWNTWKPVIWMVTIIRWQSKTFSTKPINWTLGRPWRMYVAVPHTIASRNYLRHFSFSVAANRSFAK